MNRIARLFHTPPDVDTGPPDVLRMMTPSDGQERLERREPPPVDNLGRFMLILGSMTLYVAGGTAAIWLVAFVAAHAVRFALGF